MSSRCLSWLLLPLTLTLPVRAEAPAAEAPPPKALAAGKQGSFQPGLLLQSWVHAVRQDGETAWGFRLRRVELKAKGDVLPEVLSYNVMFDVAKVLEFERTDLTVAGQEPAPTEPGSVQAAQPVSSVSVLQDASFTFHSEFVNVTVGQMKNPLSWEGYNSASALLFPERALVSRQYGDARDLGVKLDSKLGEHFYYFAGLYNGAGLNRRDDDRQKDAALRLEAYPVKGMMVGVVGYAGIGERGESRTRDRVEADLRIEQSNALLQVEYLRGWDGPTSTTRVEGHGFYAALGYTVFGVLQPAVRVGGLDTDLSQDLPAGKSDEVWHYEAALTYLLQGNQAKLALSYSFFDFDDSPGRGELIALGQVSY